MAEELQVLKQVCQDLEKAKIPYMITGSTAANFYAVPRMTRDIDIVIEIRKGDVDRFLNTFKDKFYIDRDSILEAIEKESMFNILHNESVVKIDFVVRKNSPYRLIEFERRRRVPFEGVTISVVAPEDLILSKLFWAKDSLSEMQLGDVKNLLRTLKDLDTIYLEKWIRSLDLGQVYSKVKK